jgi:hypothetical protein
MKAGTTVDVERSAMAKGRRLRISRSYREDRCPLWTVGWADAPSERGNDQR